MKKKKNNPNEITYHKTHSFIDNDDIKHTFITQLYQVGVYGILDGDPSMQGNFTPQQIVKIEKDLEKSVKKGIIKSYELGVPITVDVSGLLKEVKV